MCSPVTKSSTCHQLLSAASLAGKPTLGALEEMLCEWPGSAVIVSHDRWFLDRVCTHILAFEGDSQVFWFEGTFSEYEENKK